MKQEHEQHPTAKSIRCQCGNLLARLVPAGIEIKCRRCKRQIVIPLSSPEMAKDPLAEHEK
jgi:phage FluMu protein Com